MLFWDGLNRTRNMDKYSYNQILRISAPLILSMSGYTVMNFTDGVFLSWYSADAIAAISPAAMLGWLVITLFQGVTGYTSTLVAHSVGAERNHSVGSTVWQGIYISLAAGALIACVAFAARPVFNLVGHEPAVRALEIVYFQITCVGAVAHFLSAALVGFFTGRADTRTVMVVQIAGIILNGALATGFVMFQSLVWLARFLAGGWKKIEVIGPAAG